MLHSDPPPVSREVERLANTYANLILRLAYSRLGTTHAAQDICQDVFVKLITLTRATPTPFKDAEHEKAWIIRATVNSCINEQQAPRRSQTSSATLWRRLGPRMPQAATTLVWHGRP